MTEIAAKKKRFTKKEWSWILYDWANSVYATNIMAAIFPILFVQIAGESGDQAWAYGTSIATFIVALLAPFLGALADFKGMKKKLFTVFMLAGVVFTALIACTNDWKIMLVGYVISRIGFAGSNLFYDSFLTDVTDNKRMDKVSSWGYAMGYIGGSTIPFVISIALLLLMDYNTFSQKFSIIITSVWWIVFSIPFLKNVKQEHYVEANTKNFFKETILNTWQTAKDIFKHKGLFIFIVAYFFYIDGVGTIINVSTAYGSSLGLGSTGMIIALLVTQIVAMPCSILFPTIAEKITARKALMAAILVYVFICIVGFYMGYSLEPHQKAVEDKYSASITYDANVKAEADMRNTCISLFTGENSAEEAQKKLNDMTEEEKAASPNIVGMLEQVITFSDNEENKQLLDNFHSAIRFSSLLFWGMAVLVGTVQGGIQAVSRSYFGKIVPKERSNEFFGFFDIFGKFASVMGPALYAVIADLTGRSSYGVLCLILLFLIGFVMLLLGKKHMEEAES